MKAIDCKTLYLLTLSIYSTFLFSQEYKVLVKQDAKLDTLLNLKISLDRARYDSEYFTLQLYYGNLDVANETLESFQESFPHIAVDLSFETPNYKVQAGRFKDKIEGLKTLDTVKKAFPAAFLLTRRDLILE